MKTYLIFSITLAISTAVLAQKPESRDPYRYRLDLLKDQYERLDSVSKEKASSLSMPPPMFVSDADAKTFLDNLQVQNLSDLSKKGNTLKLIQYAKAYEKIVQTAQKIVADGKRAEEEFKKINPSVDYGENVGKSYVGNKKMVYLPLGELSFADEVMAATYGKGKDDMKFAAENCIGPPNYVDNKIKAKTEGIYSLGGKGTLAVRFVNNALIDVEGPDLYVFEIGEVEPTKLEISKNGKEWIDVGTISGGTAEIDINGKAKAGESYYFVRLTDLNKQSIIPGADVDAIAAIGAAIKLNLSAEVLFDLGKATLKQEGVNQAKTVANQIKGMKISSIKVIGHTDDLGSDATNLKLSNERAKSVSQIFQQEINNNAIKYEIQGKGEAEPTVPNTSDENRKKNRRVEIIVQ